MLSLIDIIFFLHDQYVTDHYENWSGGYNGDSHYSNDDDDDDFINPTSSFVSIIPELSHMFDQALAQWRAFSLAVARSSRLHSFSRSGHLSRCCMD